MHQVHKALANGAFAPTRDGEAVRSIIRFCGPGLAAPARGRFG